MAKKGYHHGNLREALIEASLSLIEEAEPFHFTLRQAAQRAGVAASAPYRHFENKAALLSALAEEGVAQLFQLMAEEMAEVGSPQERFQAMGIAFVKFAVAHPGYFRVMYMPEKLREAPSPSLAEALRSNTQQLAGLFEEMSEEGSLTPSLSPIQLLAAQAMTYGLARMFVDGQLTHLGLTMDDAAPLARAVTDVLGHGLAPRPEQGEKVASSLSDEERAALVKKLSPLLDDAAHEWM